MKENINNIPLHYEKVGDERRVELLNVILDNSKFTPSTVTYKDIDADFKRWVEEDLRIVTTDGRIFPTMTMFSNQRFSEYSQTWSFTDEDNNLLMNFKTITRENNPQYGKIQNGYWNIPGERFYIMKRDIVLDDNGTESIRTISMRQPVAIDMNYKLNIFTTKYQYLNDFNTMINRAFAARQVYIRPNGHYMPMVLESISDESQYNIDDRQFYSQSYTIKALCYIITDEDYRISEHPIKIRSFADFKRMNRGSSVEVEENPCWAEDEEGVAQGITIKINFDKKCANKVSFNVDFSFKPETFGTTNINEKNFVIAVNGEKQERGTLGKDWEDGDRITLSFTKWRFNEEASFIIAGVSKDVVFEDEDDAVDVEYDITSDEEP